MTQTATLATYLLTCVTALLFVARYVVKNDPTLREADVASDTALPEGGATADAGQRA